MKLEDSIDGSRGFWGGALFGMCLMIAANGINWLITPMRHPDAGTARTIAAIVQIIVSASVAIVLYVRQRRGAVPINELRAPRQPPNDHSS